MLKPSASRSTSSGAEVSVRMRIVVVRPPRDVLFGIQGRPNELLSTARSGGGDLAFDFDLRVPPDRSTLSPRLLGAAAQGPPAARFVYVCSGSYAGDTGTCWARRAKVPLAGITRALLAEARKGARLEARIDGTARDGGPVCATVPLLGRGWRAAR